MQYKKVQWKIIAHTGEKKIIPEQGVLQTSV